MSGSLYYARRSMTYGRGNGKPVDRGQVVELEGLINDEKLLRLGYIAMAPKHVSVVQCGTCGAEFITDEGLSSHGRDRHSERARSLTPQEEDARADKRAKLEDELAPLDLTKTAASRGYVHTK